MNKNLKLAIYFFIFGLLAAYAVWFRPHTPTTYTRQDVLGTQGVVELLIYPQENKQKLLNYFHSAQDRIYVTVYLLSDPDVISALKEAKKRGVDVKVILEEHPFGGGNLNTKSRPELETNGVAVSWGNPIFSFTHQKTFIIDGRVVCILNQNLTKSAFVSNREFDVCEEDSNDIAQAEAVFKADWFRQPYVFAPSNLVISPESSRGKIKALIESANQSIDLMIEVFDDDELFDLLKTKRETIPIRVLLPDLKKISSNKEIMEKLLSASIEVREMTKPYLHAKMMVVDHQRAYVGSVNFTTNSLDQNREMGIILSQAELIDRLQNQFESDWENSVPVP